MVYRMKKVITFVALLSMTSIGWAGTNREATNDRLDHAGRVLHEIMDAPDKGIPEEVLEHAKCVAVVPHLLKGGFVFGAENGRGVATCRTARRLERANLLRYHRRQLGIADRRRGRGPGHDYPERARNAPVALQQI